MQDKFFDTVIISDLHMGSDLSRAGDALDFLRSIEFRRLILLGDMFADLNFSRLTKEHWKFLSYIRKLSNPKHDIEVVWGEGNHDHGLTEVMSHLVGIRVYQQYEWMYGGRKHLAIHGHQFDSFAIKNFRITHFGQLIFLWLQKIDSRNKRFARYLDRLNTRWLRLSAQMKSLLRSGADLRGYFHWSLTDNFEWNEGWHLRFGLIELDPLTQERRPRPSAGIYAEIIRKSRNGFGG